MKNDILIDINHLSFGYIRTGKVLEDINLVVKRGDFLGLIGPNGSGKTTLLKMILGLLNPSQGEIFLFGENLKSFRDWRKIGYVPQKAGLFSMRFPITVEEVVSMGLGDKKAVTEALKSVEMMGLRKRLINDLSGGQQQKVFIARALVSNPELLILDEPTVGVDSKSQLRFYELLKELNRRRNLTLILVSHDIDVVANMVKTVACLNRTLLFHGEPKDIMKGNFWEKLYGKDVRLVIHDH